MPGEIRSIFFTIPNLEKIDRIRGKTIKRSTVINYMLETMDEDWIRAALGQQVQQS